LDGSSADRKDWRHLVAGEIKVQLTMKRQFRLVFLEDTPPSLTFHSPARAGLFFCPNALAPAERGGYHPASS
jgi:hypothetical protein